MQTSEVLETSEVFGTVCGRIEHANIESSDLHECGAMFSPIRHVLGKREGVLLCLPDSLSDE
jgi:hypothetical protein